MKSNCQGFDIFGKFVNKQNSYDRSVDLEQLLGAQSRFYALRQTFIEGYILRKYNLTINNYNLTINKLLKSPTNRHWTGKNH